MVFAMLIKFPFGWLYPLLRKGIQRTLVQNDVNDLNLKRSSEELGLLLERYWEKEFEDKKQHGKKASLLKVLFRVFGPTILGLGLVALFVECFLKIGSSILLLYLIRYFNNESQYSVEFGNQLILLMIIVNFLIQFCHHPSFYGFEKTGLKIRIAVSSLIYRKALRLHARVLNETSVGQIVNLLSNDVSRFERAVQFINYLWIGPIQGVVATTIIWYEIGVCCMAGTLLIVLYIPIQSLMGKLFLKYRLEISKQIDKRTKIMNEVISAIKVIKMYAWEKPFHAVVQEVRKLEIFTIIKMNYLKSVSLSLFNTVTKSAAFSITVAVVLVGASFTTEKIFFTISMIDKIRYTVALQFYYAVSTASESIISSRRIQIFLEMEESDLKICNKEKTSDKLIQRPLAQSCIVSGRNIYVKWNNSSSRATLSNISFSLRRGEKMIIRGPVGSGKSSLLHVILRELPINRGTIEIGSKVSYVSQVPWIFHGTIRENVLFGQPYDVQRYSKVMQACALNEDARYLPHGDLTMVGEKGASLSGGQKARINLARAIYLDADFYILDDPLSAVDARVVKHLFENCIFGFLAAKSVILATHQQNLTNTPDHIITLKNGFVETKETYLRGKHKNLRLPISKELKEQEFKLIKTETNINTTKQRKNDIRYEGSIYDSSNDEFENNQWDDDDKTDPDLVTKPKSSVGFRSYLHFFLLGGSGVENFLFLLTSVIARVTFVASDYWLSYWTDTEKTLLENVLDQTNSSESASNDTSVNRNYYLNVYTGIFVTFLITSFLEAILFFRICSTASRKLHNNMFGAVIRAPMRFFETHPLGEILNRFTKDVGQVDDLLPPALFDFIRITLIIAIVCMILYINIWMLIPAIVLSVFLFHIRWIYISTSRDIKRLEGTSRGPMFSHLSSTFEGLITIRAFQAQNNAIYQFDKYQDVHASTTKVYLAATRLFAISLDLISTLFLVFVIVGFKFMSDVNGGEVGLAISLAMALSASLQWAIRQSAEAENLMTSVERILEFTKVAPEECSSGRELGENEAMKHGNITFSDVSIYYDESKPAVLNDLCFNIEQGEKIGIVGRTGAGKSSLIFSLFRLTPYRGQILIDGISLEDLCLEELRRSLSVIPQDPIIFSGSLRCNLDPMDRYSDSDIFEALDQVQMKNFLAGQDGHLYSEITEGGANLSVGQKQLLCMGRAMLQRNKIIVMDEATANVDHKTDKLIQEIIRNQFSDCTVLTVAHRLQTVMDYDKIMMIEAGFLKEFDNPARLLENPNTSFSKLVRETSLYQSVDEAVENTKF